MTKKELQNLTEQICEAWGMKIPNIMIRGSKIMVKNAAIAFFPRTKYNYLAVDFPPTIVFNAKVLYNETFDYILNILYHELAHIFTQKGDYDIEFIQFCKLNEIWLNEE